MKILAIGAGRWGQNILKNLHALGHLAGVVDYHAESKAKAREIAPDVPIYDLYEDALKATTFDAVTIATPAPTHYQVARAMLERGLHTFVEKPMTMSSLEAEALTQLAAKQDRVLMVGHLLMYQPAVQFLKESLESKLIGDLISIHQYRLNLGRARNVENALWSLGVHDVAVAQYLVGDAPGRVVASGHSHLTPGVQDDVHVNITYKNGVHSSLHCSWLWPEMNRRTVIVGTTGMLVYSEADQSVTLHRKSINANLENVVAETPTEVVFQGSGEPLKLEMEHFVECCRTGITPRSDGESATHVVRILEMADRSMLPVPTTASVEIETMETVTS